MVFRKVNEQEMVLRQDLNQFEVKGLVFELMNSFIEYSQKGGEVTTNLDEISRSYQFNYQAIKGDELPLIFFNKESSLLGAMDVVLSDVPVVRTTYVDYEDMLLHGMTLTDDGQVVCQFRPKFDGGAFDMGYTFEYFVLEN